MGFPPRPRSWTKASVVNAVLATVVVCTLVLLHHPATAKDARRITPRTFLVILLSPFIANSR